MACAMATFVGLLAAVASCGLDAIRERILRKFPHKPFLGLFERLIDFFECLALLLTIM
jgi:hypothetical protein